MPIPLVQLFDKGPKTPEFITVDPLETQRKAIAGNLEAFPDIAKLAGLFNQFNFTELNNRLDSTDLFRSEIAAQTSKNRLDWSKGIMSEDMADEVQRNAASRAVGGGYGGTGAHNSLLARNYGLTSLALQEKAQSSEESWLRTAASIYQPGMFNLGSMMKTPDQLQVELVNERDSKFQRDYVAEQWKWYSSTQQKAQRFEAQAAQVSMAMAGTAVGMFSSMGGGMCWVARAVFGDDNPKWLQFRSWLLNLAPKWFLQLYRKHGERFAGFIKNKPILKSIIRKWMENRISTINQNMIYG
jgi:hypothetical protein